MEINSTPEPQAGSNKNRNLIIGIVVAVVLCCCCLVTGVGGYYMYQGYVQAQQALEELQNYEMPEFPTPVPFDPGNPGSENEDYTMPEFDFGGEQLPEGGLTDDTTRLTAWYSVQIMAAISGCSAPSAAGTTITVLQQPDASGVWVEEWNVDCGGGAFSAHKVTFTPENGYVNVNVELPAP